MDVLSVAVPVPSYVLTYEQTNITQNISPYVLSITYMDHLQGESDELEIELEDSDDRWINGWYPAQGDLLNAKIGYSGSALLPLGDFEIDEISPSGPPSTVRIRALATGITSATRTRTPRGWENTTLATVAGTIAKRHGMSVIGKIRDIQIDRITQYHEQDLAFLTRVAREYGYIFKVNGSKLIFSELENLCNGKSVLTLDKADLMDYSFTDQLREVPTEVKNKYHNPKTKQMVVYGPDNDQIVTSTEMNTRRKKASASADTLKMTHRAGTKQMAEAKAMAALNAANLEKTTGTITIPGNTKCVAGNVITLTGLGRLSGRYLVTSARHQQARSGGYVVTGDIKKVKSA